MANIWTWINKVIHFAWIYSLQTLSTHWMMCSCYLFYEEVDRSTLHLNASSLTYMFSFNGLLFCTVVSCMGYCVHFVQVQYLYLPPDWLSSPGAKIVHEYGRFPVRNYGSIDRDHLIVTIWLWSFPHSEYGLRSASSSVFLLSPSLIWIKD